MYTLLDLAPPQTKFLGTPMHTYFFLILLSLQKAHERIAKIRVSKCPALKFLWDFENRRNGS